MEPSSAIASERGLITYRASLEIQTALGWLALFAIAEYVSSLQWLAPTIPHTALRFVSIPLALLGVALMLRPARQAPAYTAIYFVVSLWPELRSPHLAFSISRTAIEAGEMLLISWLLHRHFYRRLSDPFVIGVWAIVILAVTAGAASLMVLAAASLPLGSPEALKMLGGSLGVAWRHWWLGNACTFLTLAGPVATLVVLRDRLRLLLTTRGFERRRLLMVTLGLIATCLFAFPVFDMSWRNFPPDVLLALRLIPVPFAMALAGRFRANGAAIAILIFSLIATYSVTGPAANANWGKVPLQSTPTQALLLVTAITCMVIAGISRQLKLALNEALEASQAKSRFIAMLNHDLRTPLNAILGFSELMRLQSVRELGDAVAPIENIHASGQRLLAMIEGLLHQADRGAGVFDLTKQPVRVSDAISTATSEIAGDIAQFGCRLEVAIPQDLAVEADPRAFRQMLLVLLGYPLRFVGADTTISVCAEHVGTDTIIEIASLGLINAAADDRDKIELQLVEALALAHGARLSILEPTRSGRMARLTFFATRAAA